MSKSGGFLKNEAEEMIKDRQVMRNDEEINKNEFAEYIRNYAGKDIKKALKRNEKGWFGKFIDKLLFILS